MSVHFVILCIQEKNQRLLPLSRQTTNSLAHHKISEFGLIHFLQKNWYKINNYSYCTDTDTVV